MGGGYKVTPSSMMGETLNDGDEFWTSLSTSELEGRKGMLYVVPEAGGHL